MTAAKLDLGSLEDTDSERKRILILISEGGGGHKMASEAMKEILSPLYDIDVVSVLPEIIYPLDYFTFITSGSFTGDDFYNFLLRKGYHRAVNVLAKAGLKYMYSNRYRIEKLFVNYLQKKNEKYDLIVSTFPFLNCGLAMGAQQLNIPFLIVPTDLDSATFYFDLAQIDYSKGGKFAYSILYDDEDVKKKTFRYFKLPEDKVHFTGFPVRPGFSKRYTPEQINALKLKHGMDPKHMTLTLILGAAGNEMLFDYTQELFKLDPNDFSAPLELNICLGRYKKIGDKISDWLKKQGCTIFQETSAYTSFKTPSGLLFHVRRFTKDIAEIMACSRLVITKTGSCSVNEGIYLGKKLLLDNSENSSSRYLTWESFNVPFVRKHGLGDAFTDINELNSMIYVSLREDLGHPVLSGAFPVPDFEKNIMSLVDQLIR